MPRGTDVSRCLPVPGLFLVQGTITSLQNPNDAVRRGRVGQVFAVITCDWCAPEDGLPAKLWRDTESARIEEVFVFNAIMSMSNLHASKMCGPRLLPRHVR